MNDRPRNRFALLLLPILLLLAGSAGLVLTRSAPAAPSGAGTSEHTQAPAPPPPPPPNPPARPAATVPTPVAPVIPPLRWQTPRFEQGYVQPVDLYVNGAAGCVLVNDYRGDRQNTLALLATTDGGEHWSRIDGPVEGHNLFNAAAAAQTDGGLGVLLYMGIEREHSMRYELHMRADGTYRPRVVVFQEYPSGAFRPELLAVNGTYWAFAQTRVRKPDSASAPAQLEAARIFADGRIERLPSIWGMAQERPVVCALDERRVGACVWNSEAHALQWATAAWGDDAWNKQVLLQGTNDTTMASRAVMPQMLARSGPNLALLTQDSRTGQIAYYVSISHDLGAHWSEPAFVAKAERGAKPAFQVAWAGERLYAFYLNDFMGAQLSAVFSTDDGKTWKEDKAYACFKNIQTTLAATCDAGALMLALVRRNGETDLQKQWLCLRAFTRPAKAWGVPEGIPAWYADANTPDVAPANDEF